MNGHLENVSTGLLIRVLARSGYRLRASVLRVVPGAETMRRDGREMQ